MSAALEIELKLKHVLMSQLNRVLHQAQGYGVHARPLHCKDAKYLRNERVWIILIMLDKAV